MRFWDEGHADRIFHEIRTGQITTEEDGGKVGDFDREEIFGSEFGRSVPRGPQRMWAEILKIQKEGGFDQGDRSRPDVADRLLKVCQEIDRDREAMKRDAFI